MWPRLRPYPDPKKYCRVWYLVWQSPLAVLLLIRVILSHDVRTRRPRDPCRASIPYSMRLMYDMSVSSFLILLICRVTSPSCGGSAPLAVLLSLLHCCCLMMPGHCRCRDAALILSYNGVVARRPWGIPRPHRDYAMSSPGLVVPCIVTALLCSVYTCALEAET